MERNKTLFRSLDEGVQLAMDGEAVVAGSLTQGRRCARAWYFHCRSGMVSGRSKVFIF